MNSETPVKGHLMESLEKIEEHKQQEGIGGGVERRGSGGVGRRTKKNLVYSQIFCETCLG